MQLLGDFLTLLFYLGGALFFIALAVLGWRIAGLPVRPHPDTGQEAV